ncbi:MAG: hypothetical protein KDK91_01940 [Gammaproteobacteria bacterium]|nr:hypothetical protein [Gammaproteobacteria bacterium]
MSLLMDALKRAEQARQAEAARRAEAGAEARGDSGLSLDPLDDDTGIEAAPGAAHDSEGVSSPVGEQTLEESLVRMDDETELELEPAPEFETDDARSVFGSGSSDFDFSLEDTSAPIPLPEDTGATLPSVRAAQRSVEEYFDGTGSVSMSLSNSLDARELGEATGTDDVGSMTASSSIEADLRGDDSTTTQRQAQAVFEAGRARPSGGRPVALAVVGVLFVGVLGAGVYSYWNTLERMFIGSPTVIAKRPRPEPLPPESGTATVVQPATVAAADVNAAVDTGDGAVSGSATSASDGGVSGMSTMAMSTSATTDGTGPESSAPVSAATGGADGAATPVVAAVSATTPQVPPLATADGSSLGAPSTPGADSGASDRVLSGTVVGGDAMVDSTMAAAPGSAGPGDSPVGSATDGQVLPSRDMLAAIEQPPRGISPGRARASGGSGSNVGGNAGGNGGDSRAAAGGRTSGRVGGSMSGAAAATAEPRSSELLPGALPNMSIRKRVGVSRRQSLLEEAYQAVQSGDDRRALRNYRMVLAGDRNDRDALLGMAAVHVQRDDPGSALAIYSRLLKRNPRDSAAQAGIIALTEGVDPQAGESRLKSLLRDEPEQAYLHFSLGNMYAQQARWAEAQQAYFDAWRQDSENPDYAFNLAVALDRLQQRKAALQYYRTAIRLAGRRYASFDAGSANARIARLETGALR